MFYTVYKITNQIDGKIYIGSHKTKDLNDNYMGSGKYLKYAQEKYGIQNFTKEILFVFDTPEQMYAKEAELVNEDFLVTENTYNLKVGGFGGFDYVNSIGLNLYGKNGENGKKNLKPSPFIRDDVSEEEKQKIKDKISKTLRSSYENGRINPFTNKTHTDQTKIKIGQKNSINQLGERNSQFDSMWITNGIENAKIKKTASIPDGWRRGRTCKRRQEHVPFK